MASRVWRVVTSLFFPQISTSEKFFGFELVAISYFFKYQVCFFYLQRKTGTLFDLAPDS